MADINSQLPVKLTDGTLTASVRDTGSNDSLNVSVVDGSGNQVTSFGSGTQYTEDVASAGAESLSLAGAIRRDTAAVGSGTDGDYSTINVDASGRLWVNASGAAVPVTDNSGSLTVDNGGTFAVQVDGSALTALQLIDDTVFAEDVAAQAADKGVAILAVRRDADTSLVGTDNDYANLQVDANGYLKVEVFDGGGSHTVDGTVTVDTITNALPAGTNAIGKLAANSGVDIGDVTINNTDANPIPVFITSGTVSGSEKNDYDTSAAVSAAATDNHDYTVVGTLLLKQITASSSGRMKVVLSVGPVASLVTKGVWFTTSANPNLDITFAQAIEVPNTSTGTVRIARTNLESAAMDVYSTIIGSDI